MSLNRPNCLTRRSFLRYGSGGFGAIAFSGMVWPLATAAAPAAAFTLAPHRRETVAAIIEALASVDAAVDGSKAAEIASAVADRYTSEDEETRNAMDVALDIVERGLQPGSFKRLPLNQRIRVLQAGVSGHGDVHRGIPDHDDIGQSVLVRSAVNIAAGPFFTFESPWSIDRLMCR